MTSRHSPRSRIQFGLVLIALGIAVGILAYIVGRADDDAGAEAALPRAKFSAEGSATAVADVVVRPDGTLCGRLLLATIVSDGHPVLDPVTSVHDCGVTRAG